MLVILLRGLVTIMTNEQLLQEQTYQVTMLYAKDILVKGIISLENYKDFQQKMQALYSPLFSKYMDETLDK